MLREANAFPGFSTDKLLDSYLFYQDILGMDVELVNDRFLHVALPGNGPLVIYQKENHKPAEFTVLNFQIENIEAKVRQLAAHGIEFLQYGPPIETDDSGISWDEEGSHIAWFRDPGGNILALMEN